jgi:hypothetical protein
MADRQVGGMGEAASVTRHLRRMRLSWGVLLATAPASAAILFSLPRLDPAAATPASVTLVALAAGMWICFTAERDARQRLERAKRAFAVHGELDRLLRDHWLVLLVVLFRLEMVVGFGVAVAVWGSGPGVAIWFPILAGLLMALAWPSEHKTRLMIARARELARDE